VSAINIMAYGARPLGAALGALVGETYGAEMCLYLAVAGFGAQALVILVSPAVRLIGQPGAPETPPGAAAARSRPDLPIGFPQSMQNCALGSLLRPQ